MDTQGIIFLSAVAATVLLVVAWACAPRSNKGIRFWPLGPGRGAGGIGPGSKRIAHKTEDD